MKKTIYYFSGTGNSLYVAKDIAKLIQADLIPIASIVKYKTVQSDAKVLGIVFPVYISELPVIVKQFAEKLETKAKYIFAVATFGGASGVSLFQLRDILERNMIKLNAGFGVHMPQNAFYKFWEKPEILLRKWRKKKGLIVGRISNGKEGFFLPNPILESMLRRLHHAWVMPEFRKSILGLPGANASMETDELIHLKGKGCIVSDFCSGCGACKDVCPTDNIKISDGRPVWGESCEGCLACLNYCPQNAISGGITSNSFRYKNPHIKPSEIQAQKSNAV